ncbi:MAG: GTPase HflX [Planctomycetes bacterium]|nr:GTPase HflX [Planctomycetota bacterium]
MVTERPEPTAARPQKAVLVGLVLADDPKSDEEPLAELSRLAETAGAEVVGRVFQRRQRPVPATLVGSGKAEEAKRLAEETGADLLIFDNDLTPGQQRNLEKLTGRRIVDRSLLILDIFATRARSRQASLQVELAQLEYQKSRLKRMWGHLERLEGAIGTRGPGEKQIEEDKRLIGKRIAHLRKQLEVVEQQRSTQASSREPYFRVSLVGYTNAGKSTLLRALTGADAYVEDKLFATLDTQTRAWKLPGRERVFLSDTVGFIRDLPHHLVASFHSTLAEAIESDLLLHVTDLSSPDCERHMEIVERTLGEIGAGEVPRLLVFNKIDAVRDRPIAEAVLARHAGSARVSARSGEGVDELAARVAGIVRASHDEVDLAVPASAGKALSMIAEKAHVVREAWGADSVKMRIRASAADVAAIRREIAQHRKSGR